MKKVLLFGMLLLLLSAVNVFAAPPKKPLPSLASLSAEYKADVVETTNLNTVMSNAVSNLNMYRKEAQVYILDQKQKTAWAAQAVAAVAAKRENDYAGLNADIARHNAQCGGKTLPEPAYSNCVSQKASLDARVAEKAAYWAKYFADWDRINIDPLKVVMEKQNVRLAQLDQLASQQADIFAKAQARSIALRSRIAEISAYFKQVCNAEASPYDVGERDSYCAGLNWDGTRRDLKPLPLYVFVGVWSVR